MSVIMMLFLRYLTHLLLTLALLIVSWSMQGLAIVAVLVKDVLIPIAVPLRLISSRHWHNAKRR
ncbi:membrane protein [marine sediment metagenome]|uniref:Membrane protein n=1 Tax=marine sediment metagenome TaxID=412755 RepID=A0A1B6NT60_9ZZZZ